MANKNILAVSLVALVAIIGGVVLVAMIQTEDKSKVAEYLMVLITVVTLPIITALLSMLTSGHAAVKETHQTVHKLANGEMDAKIEKVVRKIFQEYKGDPPEHIDLSE